MKPRWILRSDANSREVEARNKLSASIYRWWEAFVNNTGNLDATFNNRATFDVGAFMHDTLQAIDPGLFWEYGHAVGEPGHRLVITPESNRHLRPLVDEILTRAPELAGWQFYGQRLPDPIEHAAVIVRGRANCEIGNVTAIAAIPAGGRIVHLHFEFPRSVPAEKMDYAAFVLAEALLGEEKLDLWVAPTAGPVARSLFGKARPTGIALEEIPTAVDRLITQLQSKLPDRPWSQILPWDNAGTKWSTFKPKSATEGRPDEPSPRPDLIVGSTASPEITQAISIGGVTSARHSRFGETLLYLQADGSHIAREDRFDHRARLQEAIDKALATGSNGAVFAGAAGSQWDYIDFAITGDLATTVETVAAALRAARVPRAAWIRCHDTTLAAEWRGIWDDIEPPPEILSE